MNKTAWTYCLFLSMAGLPTASSQERVALILSDHIGVSVCHQVFLNTAGRADQQSIINKIRLEMTFSELDVPKL